MIPNHTPRWRRRRFASLLTLFFLATPVAAAAQQQQPPTTSDDTDAGASPSTAPPAKKKDEPDLSAIAAELESQKKELAEQKKELAEQKEAVAHAKEEREELQVKVDNAATASDNDWTNKFKIYGFTDVGVNRVWVKESSVLGNFFNSANATSFVIGNLNLYFDAQPVKGWRSLVEVRFTNAPNGQVTSVGGLGGTFKRTSTGTIDPHSNSVAAMMWGGYTVIERAHIDWSDHQFFKVRVGNFFTPFGIWNVDHGTPTLIALQLPGSIQLRQMPLRQTGIQVYGSTFRGDWELGYTATVSNGRQELSNFAFDDNRGFGGRISANNERGEVMTKLGASFYTGRVRDEQINLTSINPIAFDRTSTFDYREIVGGVDASLDVGRTRLRAEGAISTIQYEEGKHEAADPLSAGPGLFKPNSRTLTGFLLVAHQLPIKLLGIEPYATFDMVHSPFGLGDLIAAPAAGLNLQITKATMLKTQASHTFTLDSTGRLPASQVSSNDATTLVSRLVLVF